MAINYGCFIKGEELLFQLFKKHSSKFMKLDWLAILKGFMILICALYIIKAKLVVALSTAIVVCVCYLLYDILATPVEEVGKKYKVLIKKLKERFVERNRIVHEANKVLLKEQKDLLSRSNLLTKRLHMVIEERNGLKQKMEKLVDEGKKKLSRLEDQYMELSKCVESERIAYKKWRKRETNLRNMLEDNVTKAEGLENDLEDEMSLRKQIEEERDILESLLEEERNKVQKYKAQVEDEQNKVQKYKAQVDESNEIIKYLQEDRDRNLNLKQIKDEMWNVIKSEIGKNAQCLSNELAQLRVSIEETGRTEVLNAEERCDTLKSHLKKMLKQLEKLEKERDNLMEQNRVLSDEAKENLENCVLDKFEGVVDMLGAHIETHERKTEEMLENQGTLLKLLSESKSRSEGEVSSDDGYEVVE